jgi:hypothetical protein
MAIPWRFSNIRFLSRNSNLTGFITAAGKNEVKFSQQIQVENVSLFSNRSRYDIIYFIFLSGFQHILLFPAEADWGRFTGARAFRFSGGLYQGLILDNHR